MSHNTEALMLLVNQMLERLLSTISNRGHVGSIGFLLYYSILGYEVAITQENATQASVMLDNIIEIVNTLSRYAPNEALSLINAIKLIRGSGIIESPNHHSNMKPLLESIRIYLQDTACLHPLSAS